MQHGSVTNPFSPMHGSTSNPINPLQTVVDDHSSHSGNEYINLDDDTGATNNTNGDTSGKDTENNNGEDEVQLKRKRQKTAKAWGDFKQVTLSDGTKKVECIHCKTRLAFNSTGTTTTWNRHMERCLKRKQYLRTQQVLNFQPVDVDIGLYKPLPFIAPDAKYDANKMREAIANWIMVTEQPFSTVDDEMFVYMMKTANPLFERISRPTAKADCFKVYENGKKKLKDLTNVVSNISLTTDCWRSSHQKIEYMVITGHFIDQNWRLQKRVLSFVHVPPPRTALDIADCIYKCLKEWEIEGKIFSISVDNASYNDKVVKTLKTNFSRVKKLPCDGRLFHVRCCAHILNLLVKEGLSKINHVIEEVREAVKYINYSEARRQMFSNVAHQLQIHDRKLMLDVPTRWNSTYDMLSLALNFKDVFPRYADYEPHFSHVPSDKDWDNVEAVCEVLKVFKVCTNIISGSEYPTANLYLMEVCKVKEIIDKSAISKNDFIRKMAKAMKEKFDKYWGECHLLMAIAAALDPRMKKWYITFSYRKIYPADEVAENVQEVSNALDDMFKEYVEMHDAMVRKAASHKDGSFGGNTNSRSNDDSLGSEWEAFGDFYKGVDVEKSDKSELNMYLEEGLLEGHGGMKFNALEWWNIHQLKYPVLSKMAKDVLAIPISTVASEATFSAGGRVIDPYRSALKSNTVEMLICGGDWIRQNYGIKKKVKKDDIPTEVLLPAVKRS